MMLYIDVHSRSDVQANFLVAQAVSKTHLCGGPRSLAFALRWYLLCLISV